VPVPQARLGAGEHPAYETKETPNVQILPRTHAEIVEAMKANKKFDNMPELLESVQAGGCAPPVLASTKAMSLPTDSATRKNIPIASGVLDYFPAAIAEVAYVSFVGNEKHNPGEPLNHARGKSMDHADCIARHLIDRGTIDVVTLPDGREFKVRHSAYVAWRALALLQQELEEAGAPLARGATPAIPTTKETA
jgi:hypothetical protein